ncbi:hypothetical protein [Agromyces sp. Marseille-P2726]|uniref:hypothetical protein n=1 Tax=Agromyces sp. Marseille-P2726 TaxID=2709132 RepID=UPI001570EC79|nr:hypothetical protein [Agromyces sp. Marseille-P2726]
MSEALEGWNDFNVAMVGATAALAGLLIVAMSVNIAEIMKSPTLPARAAASIATLVLAIVAGAFGLMPGQSDVVYGLEVIVATVLAATFQWHAVQVIARTPRASPVRGERILKSIAGIVPIAAFLVGGTLVALGVASVGLVFIGVGSVFAIIAAILLAWVVLVELLR